MNAGFEIDDNERDYEWQMSRDYEWQMSRDYEWQMSRGEDMS